jgi:hypothetical protein
MTNDQPIACSLNATELPKRLGEMSALGQDALVDARTDGRRAELRFAAGTDVRERLETIVAAESSCCAFLTMTLSDEPDAVVLTVDAPEGAEVVLVELVAAFRSEAAAPK